MRKLEELGGVKVAKDYARCVGEGSPDRAMLEALIEHIESLTSERDALKKRVEELERGEVTVCDCHTWPTVKEMHDYCVAIEVKLQAARVVS